MPINESKKEVLWFVGSAYPESLDPFFAEHYFKADANVSNLIYERRLFEASLEMDPDATMFTLPHVGVYPQQSKKARVRFTSDNPHYIPVPFNCFFLYKHISQAKSLKRALLKEYGSLPAGTSIHIVICEAYLPYLKAVKALVNRAPGVRVTIIVPDLPEHVGIIGRGLRSWLKKRYICQSEQLMRALPSNFVLFTEAMKSSPIFQGRHCIVSNGLCGPKQVCGKEPGLFVFAGKLNESNGVRVILEAMKGVKENITCEIYGDGPLQKEVESAAKNNPAIIYGGYKEPNFINGRMAVATGILATRLSSDQSLYQFPSKIINALPYMSPIICFDLPVFEDELRKTLCIVREDAESLREAIETIADGKYTVDSKTREAALELYSAPALARKIKEGTSWN